MSTTPHRLAWLRLRHLRTVAWWRSMITNWKRARHHLADAPHLPVAAYLAFIGVATVTDPMTAHLPTWLSTVWSVSLLVGAGLIVWGVATQSTRAESTGHAFHLFGLGFLIAVSLAAVDTADIVAVAVLAGVSVMRMRVLARARAAQREASRLLRGEPR